MTTNARSSEPPSRTLVVGALLVVYLIWGSTYLGIRLAIESIPPFLMAGTRYLAAGGAMFLFELCRGRKLPSKAEWRDAFILGGCLLLCGNGGVTFAEQYVPSGTAALLVATVPIFLAIFAWIARMAPRPNGAVSFALLLGLFGVSILSRSDGQASAQHNWYLGVFALMIASVVWAVGSLYSRKAPRPASAILGVGTQMLCGGFLLSLVSVFTGETSRFDWSKVSSESFFVWCYLVVFGAIVAFTAYIWLTRVCPPALLGTYAFVNPVVAVVLGWAIAGEQLNLRTISGAAVIVGAVTIIVFFSNRTGPTTRTPRTPGTPLSPRTPRTTEGVR